MATKNTFTLVGLEEVQGNMRRLLLGMKKETRVAMHAEGKAVQLASMKRTPVSQDPRFGSGVPGTLRASHRTDTKTLSDNVITTVAVGGPAAPYARHVHERIYAPSGRKVRHTVGEAKFLEKSWNERRPIMKKVAARIDLARAGRG